MAENSEHYAIVVGLALYPQLGDPPPSDLRGPINDAQAVYDWLVDPAGGGVPAKNIELITSPDPPPKGRPSSGQIQKAFAKLANKAEKKRSGLGALLGQRLYIYVSGHGFSPRLNQGCLLAGNAGGNTRGANVAITDWLEQFQDAGYFFETVLWMDCCMNRDPKDIASPTTVRPFVSSSPPGPSFAAIAARRPLRAVEQLGTGGKYHGVFTTVLLEGLRGAAANPYGMVTGRSLADWLRNAQRARLSPADLADPRVSKEPDVLKEDPALIFGRGIEPATFDVTLTVNGAAGVDWRLWRGRPLAPEDGKVPASGKVKLKLTPGLYVFEVPSQRLRQGFEVAGPVDITIAEKGPAVKIGSGLVPIDVDPQDPAAEVYLVDESFNLVDRGIGRLTTSVPPAIYKTRIRSGDRLAEQVYLLDRSPKAADAVPDLPAYASAVPMPGTAFTHEYHVDQLRDSVKDVDLKAGKGAHLLLTSRLWRAEESKPMDFPPWAELELWNVERRIAALPRNGRLDTRPDPYARLLVELDPGTYFVRHSTGNRSTIEQAVIVLPGWRTSFFFLLTPDEREPTDSAPARVAVLMNKMGKPFDEMADLLLLQAENAIGKSRAVLTAELDQMLVEDPRSPLARILGGHLLILEQQKRPSLKAERLQPLVRRLRKDHKGIASGDLDALEISAFGIDHFQSGPITTPPMFKASWDIIAEASLARPDLVPSDLYKRVFATAAVPPFNAWSTDARSRRAFLQRVKSTVHVEESTPYTLPPPVFMPIAATPGLGFPGAGFAGAEGPGAGMALPGTGFAGADEAAAAIAGFGGAEEPMAGMAPPGALPAAGEPPIELATVLGVTERTAERLRSLGLPAAALDL